MDLTKEQKKDLKQWCAYKSNNILMVKDLYDKILALPTLERIELYKTYYGGYRSHEETLAFIDFILE